MRRGSCAYFGGGGRSWSATGLASSSRENRLQKIQPVCNALTRKYLSIYTPGCQLVIDDTVFPFRRRLSFRQYIPSERHKYGCKIFKLCTCEAYTLNFEIYCGKSERNDSMTRSEFLVTKLINPFLHNGHILYTDNYYTSLKFARHLLSCKTYLCETVRPHRKGLPHVVTKAKLERGEMKGLQNEDGIKVFN